MKRMSFSETIFLFFLALIIFGPKKLPEIARQVGKYMNEFRRASNEFKAQIEQEIAHLEVEKARRFCRPARAVEGTPAVRLELCASQSKSVQLPTFPRPKFPRLWQLPRRMSHCLPAGTARSRNGRAIRYRGRFPS